MLSLSNPVLQVRPILNLRSVVTMKPSPSLKSDTIAVTGWNLLVWQTKFEAPVLARNLSQRFGTVPRYNFGSHPEGKDIGDNVIRERKDGGASEKPSPAPRREDRSDYRSDRSSDYGSGGSREKMGFSENSPEGEDSNIDKKEGDVGRPSNSPAPVRDPSGELNPARRKVDPGASWGGNGDGEFGGGDRGNSAP